MGYADSTGAEGGSSRINRISETYLERERPRDRYRGDNCNQLPATRDGGSLQVARTIGRFVGAWSIDSFEQQRALLRSRGARQKKRLAAFVAALYAADAEACRRLTAEAIAEGGGPQAAAQTLLGPAAQRIGEDWTSDATDFLSATIALQRLQRSFHDLTEEDPPTSAGSTDRRLLLAPSPGDQHGFGLSIVQDAFQRAGWMVDCCAEDDSGATLFQRAAEQNYQVIGLSFGTDREPRQLQALAATLRASNPRARLMAGGRLALEHPERLVDAGFDVVARDAAAAIHDAERSVAAARHGSFTD
jgi:methanogenic corrinoid protein MtbC1